MSDKWCGRLPPVLTDDCSSWTYCRCPPSLLFQTPVFSAQHVDTAVLRGESPDELLQGRLTWWLRQMLLLFCQFKVQTDRNRSGWSFQRDFQSSTTNCSSFILLDIKSIFYKDEKLQQLEDWEDLICNSQSCTPWNLSVWLPVSLSVSLYMNPLSHLNI